MNSDELIASWRYQHVVERRALLAGWRQGFFWGLITGMIGAAILIVAASDILWMTH